MKNTHYQNYLNAFFDFNSSLWDQCLAQRHLKKSIHLHSKGVTAELEPLPWDSSVLGLNCWRLHGVFYEEGCDFSHIFHEVGIMAKRNKIEFLVFRFDASLQSIPPLLREQNWIEVDSLSIYFCDLTSYKTSSMGAHTHLAPLHHRQKDVDNFFKQYPHLFNYGRLFHDPHIPPNEASRFYGELAKAILNKDSLTGVLLEEGSQKLGGLALGTIEPMEGSSSSMATLWQIALAPHLQGKGYGKELFSGFINSLTPGTRWFEVGTQSDNSGANALYRAAGLKPITQASTWHWHLL